MSKKLTAKEAAELLGYHINHVYRLLKSHDLKGEQFNRVWMIDWREVERVQGLRDRYGREWKGQG